MLFKFIPLRQRTLFYPPHRRWTQCQVQHQVRHQPRPSHLPAIALHVFYVAYGADQHRGTHHCLSLTELQVLACGLTLSESDSFLASASLWGPSKVSWFLQLGEP